MFFGQTYIGLGNPVRQCQKCGVTVIDRDFTEWKLCTPQQRAKYWASVFSEGLAYGIGIPMAIWASLYFAGVRLHAAIIVSAIIIALAISIYRMRAALKREIELSCARMKDPNYRALLKANGLLREP
jgi:hypothetical protein